MKAIARAMFVIVGVVMLAGCTAAPTPDRTTLWSPGWEPEPCLGEVSYPELPVWELNESLPIKGVAIEGSQSGYAVDRGPGSCSAAKVEPVDAACPVLTSRPEDTMDPMLGYAPDEITSSEFELGATGAITESAIGYSANGGVFQYRMTAWHYESKEAVGRSKIMDIVGACDGAIGKATRSPSTKVTSRTGSPTSPATRSI
jgi:hypothetical protein